MIFRCSVCGCRIRENDKGRCKKHPRTYERTRKQTGSQYGRQWKKIRDYITGVYPICLYCRINLAAEVDHIRPLNDESSLSEVLDPAGLAPLCKKCHTWKTYHIDPLHKAGNKNHPLIKRYESTIQKAKEEML